MKFLFVIIIKISYHKCFLEILQLTTLMAAETLYTTKNNTVFQTMLYGILFSGHTWKRAKHINHENTIYGVYHNSRFCPYFNFGHILDFAHISTGSFIYGVHMSIHNCDIFKINININIISCINIVNEYV